jgi:2'-5' RNA ligase
MGIPLEELGHRMSSAEFSMHLTLARMDAKAAMPESDRHLSQVFGG